jgi:hypothetical protein
MSAHNTNRSISYQLAVKEDQWVIWCVMLLFRARLLTGQSGSLIKPIVRLVQTRKPVDKDAIKEARQILRTYHTADLAGLLNREGLR